ncbi:serine/threonine kinase family protein [Corallococcus macrosporus]|uniref:Serine/threonine kinase family protein n=1 Tax=Myxococcus fulvus (strain ATCC BAA-855 / HW-1) TaxID=483219 RepID=F8CEC0_MYXFH|nr:serine/threonine kinase family protein [Corallococcus macrosporus]
MELWLAIDEGFLSREEAADLLQDARRLRRSPLKLRQERGRISESHDRRSVPEARAQAKVKHERVCKVYGVGHAGGKVFIAMQYCEGQSLMREAAQGVRAAHRVRLIHRDIKPPNIMVESSDDGTPRPSVMDFGLAREWDESVTASGAVLGTPHDMPRNRLAER